MSTEADHSAVRTLYEVTVLPHAWRFEAGPESSLVVAAKQAGIRLPSSCRNGTCRACRCRLLQGGVSYKTARPGLTPDERDEGWILPCIAHAGAPLVLDVPGASELEPVAPLHNGLTGARR